MYKIKSIITAEQLRVKQKRELKQFIDKQKSQQIQKRIELADKLCEKFLGPNRRHSFGTDYDHCIRVALSLLNEFNIEDAETLIAAILHDILEDSDYPDEDLKIIFGNDTYNTVKALDRDGRKWDPLKEKFPDKNIFKAIQNYSIMKEKSTVSLIKSVDKLDNLRDMLQIPKDDEKYHRIPYWIIEIKLSVLPFTTRYYPETASAMTKEMASIEAVFLKEIDSLFDRYSTRVEEALYLWQKI